MSTSGKIRTAQCSHLGRCGCEASNLAHEGPSESSRGSRSLKAFFVEGGPIGNAGIKEADMYVVKVVWRVDPFTTAVVGVEGEVWELT